jgi:hypothetical protein
MNAILITSLAENIKCKKFLPCCISTGPILNLPPGSVLIISKFLIIMIWLHVHDRFYVLLRLHLMGDLIVFLVRMNNKLLKPSREWWRQSAARENNKP